MGKGGFVLLLFFIAVLAKDFVCDDAGRGALRSPTPPWGTGARGLRALSRSPRWGTNGDFWMGKGGFVLLLFFIAVLAKDFVCDDAGVGRAAPLHPLG